MDNAQLINQSSNTVEWYTPAYIIEAARQAMGSIDLDPASCEVANRTVKAQRYFTQADNGLAWTWQAHTVFMNHPFGRNTNKQWIDKLISEYAAGHFDQACCITFASTSEAWFQPLLHYPICFISPRVNYVDADGCPVKGVTKGSCVTYLGTDRAMFYRAFIGLGRIMVPAI